jgi:hypothetical protein
MIQNKVVIFICLLQYYHYLAFYIPSTPLYKKNNHYHVSNYNNDDLENNDLDSTSELFNKNIRLGRSKDQDGKSNIWSVEPKMEVIDEEITELNKNILTGGLFFTGVLASLPILYTLSKYTQNIDY